MNTEFANNVIEATHRFVSQAPVGAVQLDRINREAAALNLRIDRIIQLIERHKESK